MGVTRSSCDFSSVKETKQTSAFRGGLPAKRPNSHWEARADLKHGKKGRQSSATCGNVSFFFCIDFMKFHANSSLRSNSRHERLRYHFERHWHGATHRRAAAACQHFIESLKGNKMNIFTTGRKSATARKIPLKVARS